MTLDEAIHFAECLKHNYTINFADMEDFCDTVIESLKKEPSEDVVSRSDVMALIERTNLKYSSSFIRGISQRAFEDLLYGTLSLSPVIDFADKCRECGAEYGKLLKQTRWIPFYESEPDVGEEVLVCDVDQGIYLTWKTRYGMYFDAWGDEIKSIVAWMPLPQPYKAESEV